MTLVLRHAAQLVGTAPAGAPHKRGSPFDLDGRSARCAALFVWHFLAGLAARASSP